VRNLDFVLDFPDDRRRECDFWVFGAGSGGLGFSVLVLEGWVFGAGFSVLGFRCWFWRAGFSELDSQVQQVRNDMMCFEPTPTGRGAASSFPVQDVRR
jgi:hypothetical protein